MDDPVDDKNSADEELRESLTEKIKATNNLVEGWGFTDVIGTRYFTKDWYGRRMEKDEHGNEPEPFSYLQISAWTPKPQHKALYEHLLKTPNGLFQVTEEMVDLWFPTKLSFSRLRSLLKENKERVFKNQQLNIATDPDEIDVFVNNFKIDDMRAHTYARTAAPKDMEIIQLWDIAYSEQRTSDFSVGATVGVYKDKHEQLGVVVIDVIHDKWKSSELASQMLAFYDKHKAVVSKVYIEEANGVGFLMGNIKNLATLRGSAFNHYVRLRPPSVERNAKQNRIKDLEFLHAHDRLWFVTGTWIDDLYKQFTEYNGKKSTTYRKDDIPDCISLVTHHLPPSALKHNPDPKDVEKEHEERLKKEVLNAHYLRMFNRMSPTAPKPALSAEPAPQPRDPRQELMKKLVGKILPPGMRI
jgi:phage terminase large subunit-like protein